MKKKIISMLESQRFWEWAESNGQTRGLLPERLESSDPKSMIWRAWCAIIFEWLRETKGLYPTIHLDQTMEPKFCYSIHRLIGEFEWDENSGRISDLYYEIHEAEMDCLSEIADYLEKI